MKEMQGRTTAGGGFYFPNDRIHGRRSEVVEAFESAYARDDVLLGKGVNIGGAVPVRLSRRGLHPMDEPLRVADVPTRGTGPPSTELVDVLVREAADRGHPRRESSPLAVTGPCACHCSLAEELLTVEARSCRQRQAG